jgi:hypothetical protein
MSVSGIIIQTTLDALRGSRDREADAAPKQTRLRAIAVALSLAALWLALHPYRGVVHDGRLYAMQALNALQPERFASDLYFRYGSQDSFTVFSLLYKPLIAALGVSSAHHAVTLAGEAALALGLLAFVRTLFKDRREALFAFVGAIAVQSAYGGHGIFRYDEAFATPRPFAEALVLAAFTAAFTGRAITAGLALASAAALHPIMALTGVAALGLWAAMKDRRLLILAGAAAAFGVLLGALSVQPFARLFEAFDPEWFEIVRQRCGFGLLTRWKIGDFLAVAVGLQLAAVCLHRKEPMLRSLALVFSISSLSAMALTFLGGDLGHDVLIVNMQPWRALWLSRLLGNIVLGVLVLRAPPDSLSRLPLFTAAALSAASRLGLCLPALADFVTFAALTLYFVENRRETPIGPRIRKTVLALFGVAASSPALFASILSVKPDFAVDGVSILIAAASFGLVIALDQGRLSGVGATVAAGLALGAATLSNDRRTDWQLFLEQPGAPSDLAAFAGESSNLYWDDAPEILWFKLGRPSYYSCLQGTGAMFYRGTAIDYARRSRALANLGAHRVQPDQTDLCYQKDALDTPPTVEDIRRACRALSDLDGVVLGSAAAGASARVWTSPVAQVYVKYPEIEKVETYYEYMCADLR